MSNKKKVVKYFEPIEIFAKQTGQNLNMVIAGEKRTVKGDKTALAPIKAALVKYGEEPTEENYKAVMVFIPSEKQSKTLQLEAAKEKVEEIKASPEKTKKVAKEVSESPSASDKDLKEQAAKAKEAPKPQPTYGRTRGGEY